MIFSLVTGLTDRAADADLKALAADIEAGKVKSVLIIREDVTACGLPASTLAKVRSVVLATHHDVTTAAAEIAIASPLLEVDIQGATGVLINVAASATVTLHEVNEAINHITARADDEANIIFGTSLDESLGDEIQITVIATGFSADRQGSTSSPRAPYRATDSGAWSLRDDGVAVQEAPAPSFTYPPAAAPESTPATFAGDDEPVPAGAPQPEEVEPNDLDIPAFLRPRNRIS
mgnify:CR=1 FL=1